MASEQKSDTYMLAPEERSPKNSWSKKATIIIASTAIGLAGCARADAPQQQEPATPAVLGGEPPMGPLPDDMPSSEVSIEPESMIATPDKLKSMTNEEVLEFFTIDRDGLNSANTNWKYEWFEERGSGPNILNGGWFIDENSEEKTAIASGGYTGHTLQLELVDPANPSGAKIRPLGQLDRNFTILANTIQANREYFVNDGRSPEAEDILIAGTENILRHPELLNRQCSEKCPDIFDSEVTNNLISYVLDKPEDMVFEGAYVCGVYSTSIPELGTGTDLCFWNRSADGTVVSDGIKLSHQQAQLYPANSLYMNGYDRYADGDMAVIQIELLPISETNPEARS